MGKSAQVPLHVWLPDAMEGPTPVSALLHAATMVAAGVYLVVRAWPIFAAAPDVLVVMSWIGGITAFVAACTALVQSDIKKVLAYSTCSQLGYMVAGLGSGSFFGGYFHLTTHAFFKALLFLGAGSVIHAVGTNDLHQMGGLAKKTRATAALFAIGTLALAGLPPFAGFFSKDLVLEELAHAHAWGPLALCIAAAGLTAFYMTRAFCMAFLGAPSERAAHAHESPAVMLAPMGALAALAVIAGFTAGRFAAEVAGEEYHFALTGPGIAALAAGLGGIGLGYAKYGLGKLEGLGVPALADFIRSGPVDALYVRGWTVILRPFAGFIGWFDRYVVDGLVNLFGWAALVWSERLRILQTGQLRDYSYALVVGALLIVAWGAVGGAY
jgi:NADH-quinone oxidoreductase subunit L